MSHDRRDSQPPPDKARDAERSRGAILDAAESLFSERGFDAASLAEISALAGLSRATPSYFFGSKEKLYVAVLERAYAARDAATRKAFEPVVRWVQDGGDRDALRAALEAASDAYMRFLLRRPAFARLIVWEELLGGRGLRVTRRESSAVHHAFSAVRGVAGTRNLTDFSVADAELVFIELAFAPLTQTSTFIAALGRDLTNRSVRTAHAALVADQLMALLAPNWS